MVSHPEINQALGLPEGTPVVVIYRLRYIDGKPCVVEKSYYPTEYCFLIGEDLERRSIYEMLKKEKCIGVIAGEMEIKLTRANEEVAQLGYKGEKSRCIVSCLSATATSAAHLWQNICCGTW